MLDVFQKSTRGGLVATALLTLLAATWVSPAFAGQKKKAQAAPPPATPPVAEKPFDASNVQWPPLPAIPRIKYLDHFAAEKPPVAETKHKAKKHSWMDRMAGVAQDDATGNTAKPLFQLILPYGMAVDSKGLLYVADTKVGAIFVFNPENHDLNLLKNGVSARFGEIFGLAIDDADRLFVSDGAMNHVLVFNAQHKLEGHFGEGVMNDPNGLAIDNENRFLYVANTGSDQILVFDADTFQLLRKIGTPGKNHTLTTPGDFSEPTNLAVDKDGNLYVTDTLNDRVEIFDADGNFIRAFGKNGDGFGDFARPKGIAIDSDGHIWVADSMLNRVQIFTPEGRPLFSFGHFGMFPGQFQNVTGLMIDAKNRVFTSDQLLGRVQMFRYFTDVETRAEVERRKAEADKAEKVKKDAAEAAPTPASQPSSTTPPAATPDPQKAATPASPQTPAAASPQTPAPDKPQASAVK